MTQVKDDDKPFTIIVGGTQGEGQAEIRNLVYPTSPVTPGQAFTVEYDVYNVGEESDTLWGRIVDTTSSSTVPGSNWSQMVSVGMPKHVTTVFSGGITSDFYGRIEAGHTE